MLTPQKHFHATAPPYKHHPVSAIVYLDRLYLHKHHSEQDVRYMNLLFHQLLPEHCFASRQLPRIVQDLHKSRQYVLHKSLPFSLLLAYKSAPASATPLPAYHQWIEFVYDLSTQHIERQGSQLFAQNDWYYRSWHPLPLNHFPHHASQSRFQVRLQSTRFWNSLNLL